MDADLIQEKKVAEPVQKTVIGPKVVSSTPESEATSRLMPPPASSDRWKHNWFGSNYSIPDAKNFVSTLDTLAKFFKFDVSELSEGRPGSKDSIFAGVGSDPAAGIIPWPIEEALIGAYKAESDRVVSNATDRYKAATMLGEHHIDMHLRVGPAAAASLLEYAVVDQEAMDYIRASPGTHPDLGGPDPDKRQRNFAANTEKLAGASLRLSVFQTRIAAFFQRFMYDRREEARAAEAAGDPQPMYPPEHPLSDEFFDQVLDLNAYLSAVSQRIAIRQKVEAQMQRRYNFQEQFLSAPSDAPVLPVVRDKLLQLPLGSGSLFAGKWTDTIRQESEAAKTMELNKELARSMSSTTSKSSRDSSSRSSSNTRQGRSYQRGRSESSYSSSRSRSSYQKKKGGGGGGGSSGGGYKGGRGQGGSGSGGSNKKSGQGQGKSSYGGQSKKHG